jgi:hypothetical protein
VDLLSRKKGVGEQNMRKIRVHPLVKVRSLGKEVHNCVQGSRDMFQCVIKILEELDPPGLPARNLLRLSKILQVFMVYMNTNGMLCS